MGGWNKIDSDLCAVEGCDRPRKRTDRKTNRRSRYCSAHRKRRERTGDVQADLPVWKYERP